MQALCVALLFGCESPPAALDAGEAGLLLPTCADPIHAEPVDGEVVSVRFETIGGPAGTLPMPMCTGAPAPQAVVTFTVPGTGTRAVELSLVNSGTDTRFDTVVGVRRDRCVPLSVTEPLDACFDDAVAGREPRSRGTILAEGGDTIFVVVTGYGTMFDGRSDEGIAQLDIGVGGAAAPTLTSASALVTPETVRIEVDAGDADGDAEQLRVTFHGPAGELLNIGTDDVADDRDVLAIPFDRPVSQAVTFRESATYTLTAEQHAAIAAATSIEVAVVDRAGLTSETARRTPVVLGVIAAPGDPCSATEVCSAEHACAADMTCQPAADRVAACGLAMALPIPTPTDTSTTGRGTVVLTEGAGLFTAQCLPTSSGGREGIFRITVPAGAWDLLLTTDSSGTAGTDPFAPDTVLYVRRTCTDASPASAPEDWCNDDIDSTETYRSEVNILDVAPGDVFAFVELWGQGAPPGDGSRVELAATLRPVLGSGEACDPSGGDNRCDLGACPVATRMCP